MTFIVTLSQLYVHGRSYESTYFGRIIIDVPVFLGHKEIVYDIELWEV